MSDKLNAKPLKSILKKSQTNDPRNVRSKSPKVRKETKWDESNILTTLHPADKDYGHMKISEPKTPYEHDDVNSGNIDPNELIDKLNKSVNDMPKCFQKNNDIDHKDNDNSLDNDEESMDLDKNDQQAFKKRRRKHYSEFLVAKIARKSIIEEEDMEVEDET